MSKKIRKPTKEELVSVYSSPSTSISDVARMYNTSNPTVRKWLIEYDIVRKSQKEMMKIKGASAFNDKCPNEDILFSMIESGDSIASLKRHFEVTTNQIRHWLKVYGLKPAENKYMEKEIPSKETLLGMVENDMAYEEIQKALSVSYPTLMKWLKSYGIKRDKPETNRVMVRTVSASKFEKYGYHYFPDTNDISESKGEKELLDELVSFGLGFKKHRIVYENGDVRELDMYHRESGIAIEYSGAYWHSEIFQKDAQYHKKKYEECVKQNIQLMTFWDIELRDRRPQVISFIKSKLGIFSERLYARNTKFREVAIKQHEFFDDNHIQGRARIDRNFGLFDSNGRMVACVSFAVHHRDASKYTLNRLAFLSGVHVVGGAEKLISNAIKKIDNDVITWSDNRYSNGSIYIRCGFEFDGDIRPDYSYYDVKKEVILSKQSQKKSSTGCPENMSEHEFCNSLGRFRIWDCGKKRFVYKKRGA